MRSEVSCILPLNSGWVGLRCVILIASIIAYLVGRKYFEKPEIVDP